MRRAPRSGLLFALAFLPACATHPAATHWPAFNFAAVHRIGVVPFTGAQGPAATNEFVRQLLAAGFSVANGRAGVDAVLSGAVTDYNPSVKSVIFLGAIKFPVGSESAEVHNPVVSLSGSQPAAQALTFGAQAPQIVSTFAAIGVSVRLSDPRTARPVWAADASYEGVDLPSTLPPTVAMLMETLKRLLPSTNKA